METLKAMKAKMSKKNTIRHIPSESELNTNSVEDNISQQHESSFSEINITDTQVETQLKHIISEDMAFPYQGFFLPYFQQLISPKPVFDPIPISNKKCIKMKVRQIKQESIQVICFGWGKVTMNQNQFNQFKMKRNQEKGSQPRYCWQLIEEIVKILSLNEYEFEPLSLRIQTFALFITDKNQQEQFQRKINHQQLDNIFIWKKINLRRISRLSEVFGPLQQIQQQEKDEQILQVLSPDQRDIVERMDKNKTVGNLKQKIANHYYQIFGQIILISYTQFRLIDSRMMISNLPQNVVQIYQKKQKFIDPAFLKQGDVQIAPSGKIYQVLRQDLSNGDMPDTLVGQNWKDGKLTLRIEDKKLVERYSGGAMGYFQGDRVKGRALITLTGIRIWNRSLYLQFKTKSGPDICQYTFGEDAVLRKVLTNILVVTRIFSHHIQILT